MKKLFLIILLTVSCVKQDTSKLTTYENIDFNKDYSLLEFNKILDIYNENKGFPDIDN